MLKALELNGFKSFADRTRLAFDPGITVVVGPNGSGKSNVVDAIKWALGSQSAKSLRGKEMADVIFSGSASRRPANAAEVSLIFDNSTGLFPHEADEVEVTRRVYRSGEVEYLVNRQPQRLRDMRDLLTAAGLSTSAYCVIEQGKVDALLQSSPKQRRTIFEEAAGISRFKIKREEAARRLERVQQNLLRLTDLVDELESRLRTVRAQAGRARKHQELASRLKRLRVATALIDYRALSERLTDMRRADGVDDVDDVDLAARLAACERLLSNADEAAQRLQTRLRETGAAETAIRERIAHGLSTQASHMARSDELLLEIERLARQLLAQSTRAGDSQQAVRQAAAELQGASDALVRLQRDVAQGLSQTAELEREAQAAAQRSQEARGALDAAEKEAARLEHQIELLAARCASLGATAARCSEQQAPLEQAATRLHQESQRLEREFQERQTEFQRVAGLAAARQERLDADRQRLQSLQRQSADAQQRLVAARERTVVLEELERRLDGLTAAAREALRLAEQDPDGPFGDVQGVVADLLQVDADSAPMIEIALGDRANHLVATRSDRLCQALLARVDGWAGRLGLIRLDVPLAAAAVDRVDLGDEPGVLGRADHFVETPPELDGLARRLLGRTWLVDSLADALRLAGDRGRGLNFVTVGGEVVAHDGTLALGPRQNATGLLSRRSELRALREQIARFETEAAGQAQESAELEAQVREDEAAARQATAASHEMQQQLVRCQGDVAAAERRADEAQRRLDAVRTEQLRVAESQRQADQELADCRQRLVTLQAEAAELQETLHETSRQQRQAGERLGHLQRAVTEQRVALAGAEQRKDGLQRHIDQLLRDREERDESLRDMERRCDDCRRQRSALLRQVLDLSSESAELHRRKDSAAELARELMRQQAELQGERRMATRDADQLRQTLLERERRVQQAQLLWQRVEHERTALAKRLAEEYDIDLQELAARTDEEADPSLSLEPTTGREQVEREIRDLRQRLQASGPVNLEALEELTALEQRHASISSQHADLQDAQKRLMKLVGQINAESEQLFARTLEEIRGHFREIFQTLFGGGEADIVIEEDGERDLLECGINIVARPPGKQPRSISLLSGGERTLTCVALLLAVFRSRPSPFCVLDEVDAALDEANTDRFGKVIKEFMKSTQFIVITHSKRTMSCSDALYGITMQESGVSKQVSVRFEDVGEDGRIRSTPAPAANDVRPAIRRAA